MKTGGLPFKQKNPPACARAGAYVRKVAPAVDGEGGHAQTFHVACLLADKFGLAPEDAWPVLIEYNWRCDPPWTKAELIHKLADAYAKVGVQLSEQELNGQLQFPDPPKTQVDLLTGKMVPVSAGICKRNSIRPGGAPVAGLRAKPTLDGMRPLTEKEILELSVLRKIPIEGISYAAQKGFLFAVNWHGQRCFGVKDRSARLIELRRADGQHFPAVPECVLDERKSHAVKNSNKAWPLGILEASNFSHVALVEGIPDFLYAHWRVVLEGAENRVAVIAMLSASPAIYEGACFFFADKTIRIFPHMDIAGVKAAERWQRQLIEYGAKGVDIFDLSDLKQPDGNPVNDLCDLISVSPEELDADPELKLMLP
jgi:hypothetical protein